MATAWRLSMVFYVAVLVASGCFADVAYGAIPGRVIGQTILQSTPGLAGRVITTLPLNTEVSVSCRRQNDFVFDDPWWLQVAVQGMVGWMADYYVQCAGAVGPCIVPVC